VERRKAYSGELNAEQAAAAMQAARLNALDLLDTAEVLFNLRRLAHSIAFSILAIEETGKLPLLLMIFLGFGERTQYWKAYWLHRAKTRDMNVGIEVRVRATFPEIPGHTAREIGERGPTPDELESTKQRAIYSDCLEHMAEVICHLPRNVDWRDEACARLNEARALVHGLRDYPPEELRVWLRHAKDAQARGEGYRSILRPLEAELVEKGFVKAGQWNPVLKLLGEIEEGERSS
jgi:AbiV family abortive infection protein